MEVILLERVAKLGQMGEVVRVKDGFARNFLLPKGKALRATEDNRSRFESMKVDSKRESRAKGRSRKGRPEARRQELPGAAPGLGNRPALRLGLAARSRRPGERTRVCGQPRSDRAQHADQDHRTAQGAGVAASGGRGDDQRSRSRATPTRPSGWRAARTSPSPATKPKKPPSKRWRRRKPSSSPRWWRPAAARKPPRLQAATQKQNRRNSHQVWGPEGADAALFLEIFGRTRSRRSGDRGLRGCRLGARSPRAATCPLPCSQTDDGALFRPPPGPVTPGLDRLSRSHAVRASPPAGQPGFPTACLVRRPWRRCRSGRRSGPPPGSAAAAAGPPAGHCQWKRDTRPWPRLPAARWYNVPEETPRWIA